MTDINLSTLTDKQLEFKLNELSPRLAMAYSLNNPSAITAFSNLRSAILAELDERKLVRAFEKMNQPDITINDEGTTVSKRVVTEKSKKKVLKQMDEKPGTYNWNDKPEGEKK